MSDQDEQLGRLDDDAEQKEPSSTSDGPAADGEYDAAQGSPDSGPHVGAPGNTADPAGATGDNQDTDPGSA